VKVVVKVVKETKTRARKRKDDDAEGTTTPATRETTSVLFLFRAGTAGTATMTRAEWETRIDRWARSRRRPSEVRETAVRVRFGFGSRPSSFTKSAKNSSDAPDESVFEDAPTPYVTIVFAHCSLNLYHHPGVLGCRRSSPAGERERVEKVRDALVAVRAAAFESAAAAASYKPEETDDSDSGSIESGSSRPPTELEHAAHVTASAASTLPRLAARAACEAVWAARERLAARTKKRRRDDSSLASAAAELAGDALEAFRSNDLQVESRVFTRENEKQKQARAPEPNPGTSATPRRRFWTTRESSRRSREPPTRKPFLCDAASERPP
jgi:hypothetical protein